MFAKWPDHIHIQTWVITKKWVVFSLFIWCLTFQRPSQLFMNLCCVSVSSPSSIGRFHKVVSWSSNKETGSAEAELEMRSSNRKKLWLQMQITLSFLIFLSGDVKGYKGRNNSNNVDLNRNFPDQFTSVTGTRQQETIAVMNWLKSISFVLSANLHGGTCYFGLLVIVVFQMFCFCRLIFVLCNSGSLVVNYPFDDDKEGLSQYSLSPDDKVFQLVSKAYSQVTGHCCCQISFMLG